ncbi:MAG: hypothetical protein ACJAV5_002021 [Vicingaceae bacterium]|jgi:hypothetical protein
MKKRNKILWTIVIIIAYSILSLCVVIYLTEENNFDPEYTEQLDKYELARNEIKLESDQFKCLYTPDYKLFEELNIDYTIRPSDITGLSLPKIKVLFEENLIEQVIITQNGEVIFMLKSCFEQDCDATDGVFTGPYTHFLTKDKVKFNQYENWMELIEQKNFDNWTYYIVWNKKG